MLVSRGQSPAREKQLAKLALASNSTMRDFAERYYREVVLRDRKDPRSLRRYLDNEILPTLGSKTLRDVTAGDVQALVFRKRDNGQEAAAADMRGSERIFPERDGLVQQALASLRENPICDLSRSPFDHQAFSFCRAVDFRGARAVRSMTLGAVYHRLQGSRKAVARAD